MATITKRRRKDGSLRYTAQIRIRRQGKIIHTESRTFSRLAVAREWAREREERLAQPGELERVAHVGIDLGELFKRYREEVSVLRPPSRSKDAALRWLEQQPVAKRNALTLRAGHLVEHARQRRLAGTAPSTVQTDLSWIRVVCRYARRAWGLPIPVAEIDDAVVGLREARIISRPRRRTRRPTADELQRLEAWFDRPRRAGPSPQVPMALVMWLAIYSGRRQDELCRILRDDLDEVHGVYTVRDVKHPDGAAGNDKMAMLPPAGWQVVQRILEAVPDDGTGRLLPVEAKTVGTAWSRACKVLGIADLRFHDLRHEALSRLAEDGATVPQLQQVSLHDSWSSLSVYVNLSAGPRPKRAEWSGLVSAPPAG